MAASRHHSASMTTTTAATTAEPAEPSPTGQPTQTPTAHAKQGQGAATSPPRPVVAPTAPTAQAIQTVAPTAPTAQATQTVAPTVQALPTPTPAPTETATATPTLCPFKDSGIGVTFYSEANYSGQSWTWYVPAGNNDSYANLPAGIAGHLGSWQDDNSAWHIVTYIGLNGTGNLGHWDADWANVDAYWQATLSVKIYINRTC